MEYHYEYSTYNRHRKVRFITVQNLVGIDAMFSIIMQVLIFCEFGLKTPIHAPKTGFWGGFDPLSGELSHRDPEKALMVAEARCMSH